MLLLGGAAPSLHAQALGYRASWFRCAIYDERRTADVRSETAGRARQESVRRSGVLVFLAADGAGADSIPMEAWYDSLALVRRTPDGDLAPDTDGMLGGRFAGLLLPDGGWRAQRRPFVPADVAEASDVGATLDDLLPRLPAFGLRPGGKWRDTTGAEFERLADSLDAGGTSLVRLVRRVERQGRPVLATGEAGPGATEQISREEQVLLHPVEGVLLLERRISVSTDLPAGPTVRSPVKASVVERLSLTRRREARPMDGCP